MVEQFVRKDPVNLPARRLLAQIYEVTAPDQALVEWEALTKAEPGNSANTIGYATAVIKVGQVGRLPEILAALEKLAPESADYHRLAAGSALATGDFVGLRKHVDRLAALEPQNPLTRFTRAALQMNSPDPREVEQARVSLEEFAHGDALRIRATLALITDAPRRWPEEKTTARLYTRLADELKLRGTGSAPHYVKIQGNSLPSAGLPTLIDHMAAQPALTANDAVMLAQWMLQIGQAREALFWLDGLDEPLRTTGIVRQSMATCAATLESWPRLEQLVSGGAWGPVPAEAVKLAFASHALRAAQNDSKAGSQWSSAIRLSEQSLPGLRVLQRLARLWRWPDKQAQVLWVLVRHFPADEPAWRALTQLALVEDNSAELWRIYQAWTQAAPANLVVQAERIFVGLLTRPGETGLGSSTEELFRQHPGIPAHRVARALALWRAGRAAEALALLDAVDLNYEREPRFALTRGLILATLGHKAESEAMFALGQKTKLLPEERVLLAQARQPGNPPPP